MSFTMLSAQTVKCLSITIV